MDVSEELVYQLKRIADSLEIISGRPVRIKEDADIEQLKQLGLGEPMCKEVHQDIVDEWNRELVPLGVPKITAIRNNRAKMVSARIKEHGKESFHQCIEEVKQSSFLLGRTYKPWTQFNFDWMICPNNFTKVLEGNYNDNRSRSVNNVSGGIPESWAR